MRSERVGALLVEGGLLSAEQVKQVLKRQEADRQAFGPLAEAMFGVPLEATAKALTSVMLRESPQVNLVTESLDDSVLRTIDATDAWEHLVLPLREEIGTVVYATTVETLPNAIELLQRATRRPFRFVIAEIRMLEQFIAERYGYEGIEVTEAGAR